MAYILRICRFGWRIWVFQGFTEEMPAFFAALSFNNNRTFFQDNRKLYERAVKEPLHALAEDLIDVVHELDPELDTRPSRTVSRINRDVRFSRDKSPYRDYMWIGFRSPGESREETCGFYFDISAESSSWGCGYYHAQPEYMQALRNMMLETPEKVLAVLQDPALIEGRFQILGQSYKRIMEPPPTLPEPLHGLYRMKNFFIQHTVEDYSLLYRPELVGEIEKGFRAMAPFYRLMRQCMVRRAES